jgi:hypothetical protein
MSNDTESPQPLQNASEATHKAIFPLFPAPTRRPQIIPAGMKTVYLDDAAWVELAQARGLKLPNLATAPTSGKIEHWLHRLCLTGRDFTAWCGFTPAGWIATNPTWSLRALVGLLLEDLPAA